MWRQVTHPPKFLFSAGQEILYCCDASNSMLLNKNKTKQKQANHIKQNKQIETRIQKQGQGKEDMSY